MARLLRRARMEGPEQAQLCSSLLSWKVQESWAGGRSVGFGVSTASNPGPDIYPTCQLGGIMLPLPHRMVVRIK